MKNTPVKSEGQFAEQKIKEILNDESVKLYRVDGYEATQSYLVINREKRQFDIYSVTFKKIESENDEGKVKVLDEVYQTDTIPYENLHSAEADKFVMVAHFTFDGGEVIKITNLSDNIKRFTKDLNELGITTNLLERKWYNKILGFRTKKKWKMAIATFAYLVLIAIVVGMFTGDEEPTQEEVVASEESIEEATEGSTADEKEKQEEEEQKKLEEEKAEKEAKEKEEAEKRSTEEKEQKEKEEKEAKEKEEAEKKAAEEKKAEEEAQKEQEEKERKEQEEKEKKIDNSALEQEYLSIMRENMGMYVDVTFDKENKTYVMTPTDPQLIDEIALVTQGIGKDNWNYMVDSLIDLSESGTEVLGSGYSIYLANPYNTDNILVVVTDGVLFFDAME